MAKTPMPLNFATADERDKWIIANAEYFTIIHRKDNHNIRTEVPTFDAVKPKAKAILEQYPTARLVIYAVYREYTGYVGTMTIRDVG